MKQIILLIILTMLFAMSCEVLAANPHAIVLSVEGPIGPATQDYVQRGLHYAETQQAKLVILRLDTPGGLESATHNINKSILASTIPVVAYVPSGAHAGSAALKQNVIDLTATSISDLLKQVNGRTVKIKNKNLLINTTGLQLTEYHPDWRTKFLSILTNPNIAYILLLIGIYGLFLEFYHPGFILPGVVGTVSVLLALYAFQLLPVNYAGIALILLGTVFMCIEILISSFGILGIGGILAFVTGSILLLDINSPGYQIAWQLIIAMTLFSVFFFLLIVGLAIKAMRKKVAIGKETMIGAEGKVVKFSSRICLIKINGEIWHAVSSTPLHPEQIVKITHVDGLTLTVKPIKPSPLNNHDI